MQRSGMWRSSALGFGNLDCFVSRNDGYKRIPFLYSAHVFLHESYDIRLADRFEDIGATAREESAYHREARVFRRSSDKCHDAFLDPGEEDILLGLTPPMYLIEEEDRLTTFLVVFLGFCDDFHDVFFFGQYS